MGASTVALGCAASLNPCAGPASAVALGSASISIVADVYIHRNDLSVIDTKNAVATSLSFTSEIIGRNVLMWFNSIGHF